MSAETDQVAVGVVAGADDVVDSVIFGLAGTFQSLAVATWAIGGGDLCGGKGNFTGRLQRTPAEGVGHGGSGIAFDLGLVAEDAALGASDSSGRQLGRRRCSGRSRLAG